MEKYIDAAVEQFRTLLNEQIARERKMEQDKRYTDYKKLDKIIIGILFFIFPSSFYVFCLNFLRIKNNRPHANL